MRGRHYSLCSTLEKMRQFWLCCRQALPWDYFRIPRHSGATHLPLPPCAERMLHGPSFAPDANLIFSTLHPSSSPASGARVYR